MLGIIYISNISIFQNIFRSDNFHIDLEKVDKYIVGDLCLGQPKTWPKGEEGFVRRLDPQAKCTHPDGDR